MTYLNPETVKETIESCGNRFITVEFHTKKGEHRRYNGQLRALSRLSGGGARSEATSQGMRSAGNVWLALPNGESKSFNVARVIRITVDGKTIEESGS